jgi:hypothetical protein
MRQPGPERLATIGLLLAALLLGGCTQWRYELGKPLSPETVSSTSQLATLAEVLAELGPPQRVSAIGSGYVLAWEFWQVDEDTAGLSLGALGTDLLSVDWGKSRISGDFLLLTFNRQHQVTSRTFSHWDNHGGGGQAIQPMLGLVSLVDVEDLVDHLPHHQWGAALLAPIPEAINTDSRPDMGQSGIQQRGTPTGTGQQSLEINRR